MSFISNIFNAIKRFFSPDTVLVEDGDVSFGKRLLGYFTGKRYQTANAIENDDGESVDISDLPKMGDDEDEIQQEAEPKRPAPLSLEERFARERVMITDKLTEIHGAHPDCFSQMLTISGEKSKDGVRDFLLHADQETVQALNDSFKPGDDLHKTIRAAIEMKNGGKNPFRDAAREKSTDKKIENPKAEGPRFG